MSTGGPEQADQSADEQVVPQYLLPASIQLQNALVVEINARRYPVEIALERSAASNVGLEEIQLADDSIRAQVILSIQVGFREDPKPFDISFKIAGVFVYLPDTPKDAVLQFLSQGSLGVLLPFARELLVHLCTRLQIPTIILPMIQLNPLPPEETPPEEAQEPSSHE